MTTQRFFQAAILLVAFTVRPDSSQAATSPQLEDVKHLLPQCSFLFKQIEHGRVGDGVDRDYMQAMRSMGIRRVVLELDSNRNASDARLLKILFFSQYADARSQITDQAKLSEIERSGLRNHLVELARTEVANAPIVTREDNDRISGSLYSFVEFFDNGWLPSKSVHRFAGNDASGLTNSAVVGDYVGVRRELRARKHSRKEVTLALLSAALTGTDNEAVFSELLTAGISIDSQNAEGTTALMNAVSSECNLRALLSLGANPTLRDKNGKTALDIARDVKDGNAVRLLQEGPPHGQPGSPGTQPRNISR